MNFFSSTVTTLVARFFSILCGVLTGVLTARALGPEGRGILAIIISTSAIGVTLGLAGLAEANTYFVAGDRSLSRRLTANSLWTALMTGILADGIIVSVYLISPGVFESIPFEFLLVGLISVPFVILGILIQRIYLGQNRIVMFNAYELLTRALILVATFTVLYLLKMQLYTYLLTYAAIFAASSVYFFFRQEIDLKSIARPDFALIKSSLGYGWRAYAATLLPFFLSRVGLYFVNAQVGAEHAGYYSVAMQANDLFLIIPGVLGMLLFPRVAANKSDSSLTLKTFRFTLMLMLPIFVIAQIFTEQIVVILFGVEFLPAVPIMRLMFVGGFAIGLAIIFSHDLAGRGYPLFMVFVWIPLNVLNVLLTLLLVPTWSGAGAALALTVTYSCGFIVFLIYFKQYVRLEGWLSFIPKTADFKDLFVSGRTAFSNLRERIGAG